MGFRGGIGGGGGGLGGGGTAQYAQHVVPRPPSMRRTLCRAATVFSLFFALYAGFLYYTEIRHTKSLANYLRFVAYERASLR